MTNVIVLPFTSDGRYVLMVRKPDDNFSMICYLISNEGVPKMAAIASLHLTANLTVSEDKLTPIASINPCGISPNIYAFATTVSADAPYKVHGGADLVWLPVYEMLRLDSRTRIINDGEGNEGLMPYLLNRAVNICGFDTDKPPIPDLVSKYYYTAANFEQCVTIPKELVNILLKEHIGLGILANMTAYQLTQFPRIAQKSANTAINAVGRLQLHKFLVLPAVRYKG